MSDYTKDLRAFKERLISLSTKKKKVFAYHNESMFITALSTTEDDDLSSRFSYVMLAYDDAQDYMTGKKDLNNTILVQIKDTNKYYITTNNVETQYYKYIENYIQPIIVGKAHTDPTLLFVHENNKVHISIHNPTEIFIDQLTIRCQQSITLYTALKDNPTYHLNTYLINVEELIENTQTINVPADVEFDIYTTQHVDCVMEKA